MMCCFSICLVELIKMPLSQGAVLFCLEQRNLGGSVLKVSAAALQGCVDGKATFGRVRLVCGSQAPLPTASKQDRQNGRQAFACALAGRSFRAERNQPTTSSTTPQSDRAAADSAAQSTENMAQIPIQTIHRDPQLL